MPSITCFNFRFTPSVTMSCLTILVLGLFLRLGFWQLERAQEKQQIITTAAKMAIKPLTKWSNESQLPQQFEHIEVAGYLLNTIFLLDNQHQNHQFGYNVLSVLQLDNDKIILIDRGWIQAFDWNKLPKINIPRQFGNSSIQGNAYYPSPKQWLLGPNIEQKADDLYLIEKIDSKMLAQILHKEVYPFIIRLNKPVSLGFVRHWPIIATPVARHIAYAWQWFFMAFALFIIFIALNLKKDAKI